MSQTTSPTIGRRCELVGKIGVRDIHGIHGKAPQGTIIARNQGNYTVKLERVDERIEGWCRAHGYPLSADGRVMGGPGRVRIIANLPDAPEPTHTVNEDGAHVIIDPEGYVEAHSLPLDQAEELAVGCITWTFPYDGLTGHITVWPDLGRAALCYNGDSIWGDWSDAQQVLISDAQPGEDTHRYNRGGECIDPDQPTMNQFHLFRAPGEPGYIEGAMTPAGHAEPCDPEDATCEVCGADLSGDVDEQVQACIAELGLTWLANGDLVGPCGLELPEDYEERIAEAAQVAWDAVVASHACP